jgi:integrase
VRRDRDKGILVPSDERLTVKKYLADWLESIRPPELEQSTWERREEYVRLHIVPVIGHIGLTKLTPQQVRHLYTQKLTERSQTTVHHIHATLHRALEFALRLGLVQRNVTEMVDAPPVEHQEMKTWTSEESMAFMEVTREDRLHCLYVIALSTGMRQGELLGLRWRDIDLARIIHGSTVLLVSGPDQWVPSGWAWASQGGPRSVSPSIQEARARLWRSPHQRATARP